MRKLYNKYQDQKFLEPIDGDGGCREVVYVDRYVERPNTPGNKIGNYVARLIDTSINVIKGLLKKLG